MSLLPNLLRTRRGRVAAFFLLCVSEGLPQGFTASVMATFLRRQGVGPRPSAPSSGSSRCRGRSSGRSGR